MTPTAPVTRSSASVVLWRERNGQREVYWVRRSREVSLGGGFFAFPGGRLDGQDALLADTTRLGEDASLRVAGVRELFEETGVLLARGPFDRRLAESLRTALLAGETRFDEVLARLGAEGDWTALDPAGRWITPPFVKGRFDARFFLARAPDDQEPVVWQGELVSGEWTTCEAALERWQRATALLHPPALHLLRTLRDIAPPACLPLLASPPHVVDHVATRIEFQEGLFLVPLRTPTLPPATHTNCYVIGEKELVVIDPASPWEAEQQALSAFLATLAQEGRHVREILLTHEHHDHVGGVEVLRKELGVPVRAHEATIDRLRGKVRVDARIEDGEVIDLPGPLGLRLRAIHTPGHAAGHLCFLEEGTGALIAGDMVAGIGSIVIDPPDGNMAEYMASLRKLRALPVKALYPAHGPAAADGPAKLDEYLAHREDRERQVMAALVATGGGTPEDLVPHVYSDVVPAIYPLAARSLLAVLAKLEQEGRVRRDGPRHLPT